MSTRRPPTDAHLRQFQVAPWHADGGMNPCGVAWGRRADLFVPVDRMLLDYSCDRGWECRKCGAWVPKQPRQATGVEPIDWWWCNHCREKYKRSKNAPKTAKTIAGVAGKDVRDYFNRDPV